MNFTVTEQEKIQKIITPLISWYQEAARVLPWRQEKNLYNVWVSEVMLQQTRVEAVKPYYKRFMKRLPTIHDLSIIEDDELNKLWEGLGYYSRVRNLKKAAQIIEKTKKPETYLELLDLPGIGSYTAGAIASIVLKEAVPAVDGNVFRVITRILENPINISEPKAKKEFERFLLPILPGTETGDFNQALMELGATVCVPNGLPNCEICPIKKYCQAQIHQTIVNYPVKNKKKKRKIENRTILLILNHKQIIIRKRKTDGLLANLFEFPNLDGHLSKKDIELYLKDSKMNPIFIKAIGSTKHIFTHIEWNLTGYLIQVDDWSEEQYNLWVDQNRLINDYALPTAFKYYKDYLIEYLGQKK